MRFFQNIFLSINYFIVSGRGPLRTTMDVIHAAKMISECGSKLNKLAKDVAAQVNSQDLFFTRS